MFTLTIKTGNSAFHQHDANELEPETADGGELARILRELARRIETGPVAPGDGEPVRDANGNRVGAWSFARD